MKKNILSVCTIWIALILISFAWNFANEKKEQKRISLETARSFFQQVLLSRAWNASHGGVYVPVSDTTRPNPYLEDDMRDIHVNKTVVLTKINPAFMTRQIAELANQQSGIQFNITSLNPIRPENKPTALEKTALKGFRNGKDEIGEFITDGNNQIFFYMAPLVTEKSCLECHAKQGYKEGDIRGGISVILPFVSKVHLLPLVAGHLFFAAAGITGIILWGFKLNRAYETIQQQSIIDALTGIPNRRSFSERILEEFNRNKREHDFLSVIMGDIDYFKSYNDTYGHTRGDECLQKVALAIHSAMKRPSDFCARYGGEEFVIVLPNTSKEGGLYVAENIRAVIQNLGIINKGSSVSKVITMSLGVATADSKIPFSHEDLIKCADDALYRAKEKGRNRVEFYES